jgi:hypothetical protein
MERKYGSMLMSIVMLITANADNTIIGNERGKNAFAKAVVLSFKWPFLSTVVPRVCVVALKLVQPFLVQRSINYINVPAVLGSQNTGYGLIAAYGLVYLCIAVKRSRSFD